MATTNDVRQQLVDLISQATADASKLLADNEHNAARPRLEAAKLAAETLKSLGEQPVAWLGR